MPLFHYEALDKGGQKVIGSMQVTDPGALERRLTAMGYVPLLVEPVGRAAVPAAVGTGAGRSTTADGPVRPRVLAQFYYQVTMSLRAGLPAFQALDEIAAQTPDSRMRGVILAMAEVARSGGRIADGMARFPGVFPPGDTGLLRAGELGGFVVEALQELSSQLEADIEAARRCRRFFLYFGIVCGIAAGVTLPLIVAMKPALLAGIEGGASRPEIIAVLLRTALRTLLLISVPVVLGLVFLWQGVRALTCRPASRRRWHRFLLGIPGFGGLAYARSRAVFSAALRLLYHGGVNAGDAWAAASEAVPNLELGARLAAQNDSMRQGARFSDCLRSTGLFPASDVGMLATGERTGNVEEALRRIAGEYHGQSGDALERLPVAARVLTLILGSVVTVGLVAFGLITYFSTLINANFE